MKIINAFYQYNLIVLYVIIYPGCRLKIWDKLKELIGLKITTLFYLFNGSARIYII